MPTPNANLTSVQRVEVERVHRVTEFEQHVVRDVDERADGPDAGSLEPCCQPGGGVGRRHICNRRSVPGAEFCVFDRHGQVRRDANGHVGKSTHARRQLAIGQVEGRRDFTREAGDAQAVWSIRGHLEVDDRIVSQMLD